MNKKSLLEKIDELIKEELHVNFSIGFTGGMRVSVIDTRQGGAAQHAVLDRSFTKLMTGPEQHVCELIESLSEDVFRARRK